MNHKRRISIIPPRRFIILLACSSILIVSVLLAYLSLPQTQHAHAAQDSDFSQAVASISANQAQFAFQPNGWSAGYVILHYTVNGANQQNVQMAYNSGASRWEYTVGGLSTGNALNYSFTYQKNGLQYDSNAYSSTFGSPPSNPPTPVPTTSAPPTPTASVPNNGTFPVTFQNTTHGTWANNQIYILIFGQATPGQWSYLKSDGTLAHINHLDASAPNHLTKNGVNYANMSFTLEQASTVPIPQHLDAARIYISLGSPLYIPIAPDDSGWGGPNPNNPADPNIDVYFDWYEFTYQYNVTPFGGNTTQVDLFGFPMTARLQQPATNYDQTVGIALSREQVFSQYNATVSPAFKSLLSAPYRILAPRTSAAFAPGGANATYLQPAIDQMWSYYVSHQFSLTRGGATFSGGIVNGQLQFTRNGAGPFFLKQPNTTDVLACSGPLADGAAPTEVKELGAEVCAALNRGVALNTANWHNSAAYYTTAPYNDYAAFWHHISLDQRAYGFPYDDVNDQSTFKNLPNANQSGSLTLSIGW